MGKSDVKGSVGPYAFHIFSPIFPSLSWAAGARPGRSSSVRSPRMARSLWRRGIRPTCPIFFGSWWRFLKISDDFWRFLKISEDLWCEDVWRFLNPENSGKHNSCNIGMRRLMREDHSKMQSYIQFISYGHVLQHITTESSYTAVAQSLEHPPSNFFTAGVGPFLAARPGFGAGWNRFQPCSSCRVHGNWCLMLMLIILCKTHDVELCLPFPIVLIDVWMETMKIWYDFCHIWHLVGRLDLCTGGAPNFRPGEGGHGCSRLGPAEECGGRASPHHGRPWSSLRCG